MAAAHAWRTALGRLGFSNDAQVAIVNNQQIDNTVEFGLLSDSEVSSLCKVVRRPGGADANGDAAVGTMISLRAENNLKLACGHIRYHQNVSRTITPVDITLPNVRSIREHLKWEEKHEDADQPKIDVGPKTNWPKLIETLIEYFKACNGSTGIPLAYVIRPNVEVPAELDDPADNYLTRQEELIARAPHVQGDRAHPTFSADNQLVWQKLQSLMREKDCWTYVRPGQRTRDGRLAFLSLKNHYLGPNSVDLQSAAAEKILQTTEYVGEKRRWNFEKYSKLHKDQHTILHDLEEFGYAGIDPRSKVRYLMTGIKTFDLDSVKTQIMANDNLRTDFDKCVTLYKDFIQQRGTAGNGGPRESRIAKLDSVKFDDVKPDMSVQDRYYKKEEYKQLTREQKKGLLIKRKGRTTDGRIPKKQKTVNLNERSIKSLTSALADSLKLKNKDGDDDAKEEEISESDSDGDKKPAAKKTRNRDNKNLQRKK